jgi:hypothetical protein
MPNMGSTKHRVGPSLPKSHVPKALAEFARGKAERGAPTLFRLRVLNGLYDGWLFEISMVCELLGQGAVDE